jgi:MFS family permease
MTTLSPRLGSAGLTVLLAGQLLPIIDFSILNVTLAPIAKALGASEAQLELMVAVYGVAFAVCLAMGGRLGDRFGRRRVFGVGVAMFGLASLLCGVSTSVTMMLGARILQGTGAALIVPQILATIHVTTHGREHSRALAAYASASGLAFVAGQVLGGILVTLNVFDLGWRIVFLINLPMCVGILFALPRAFPETRSPHAARVDWPGTTLLACLVTCILLPLALGPVNHWSWPYASALVLVPFLAWALYKVELRQERLERFPLLPPALLRLPSIRQALLVAVLFFSGWSGFMFAMALLLQAGAGMTPMQSGNAFVALGLAYFMVALQTSKIAARIGLVRAILIGSVIQVAGLLGLILTLHLVWPHPSVWNLIPATVFMGFGQAFIVSSVFRLGLSDVPSAQAGAGSAMLSTVQQAAFGLGSTLLGGIFAYSLQESGSYLDAVQAALLGQCVLMITLMGSTVLYGRQQRARRLAARAEA